MVLTEHYSLKVFLGQCQPRPLFIPEDAGNPEAPLGVQSLARLLYARDHLQAATTHIHPARWSEIYARQLLAPSELNTRSQHGKRAPAHGARTANKGRDRQPAIIRPDLTPSCPCDPLLPSTKGRSELRYCEIIPIVPSHVSTN
jgi:hypothetical protein